MFHSLLNWKFVIWFLIKLVFFERINIYTPCHKSFQHWSSVVVKQMNFILQFIFSHVFNGLFTLPDPDSDSNSDCKPNGYIERCRTFHTARNRTQIPIPTAQYRNGIGINIEIGICICECKHAITTEHKSVYNGENKMRFTKCTKIRQLKKYRTWHTYNDHQFDKLSVCSLSSFSCYNIPLFRCTHDYLRGMYLFFV